MKRIFSGMSALLLLAGCNDYSTPRGAVQSASEALMKNKRTEFKASLTGAALEKYGNDAAIDALLAMLRTFKDLRVDEATLTASTESMRKYRVPVYGTDGANREKQIFDIQVSCIDQVRGLSTEFAGEDVAFDIESGREHGGGGNHGGGHHGGGGHQPPREPREPREPFPDPSFPDRGPVIVTTCSLENF